jgi:hypothetical protein
MMEIKGQKSHPRRKIDTKKQDRKNHSILSLEAIAPISPPRFYHHAVLGEDLKITTTQPPFHLYEKGCVISLSKGSMQV